jgi:putative PIN family toxin of toxin-antitoxin system
MPLTSDIVAAYRNADYVVLLGNAELHFRVGKPSSELDALLAERGATGAAFLTAVNPHSERRPAEENRAAAAELDRALADVHYSRFPAEGRDPTGHWPTEPGVLVLGIPRAAAEALGRRFGQNAILYMETGSPAELVLLAGKLRLVLDTNVWLDLLVFHDPSSVPIRDAVSSGRAEILLDVPCFAELEEVLSRPFRRTFDPATAMAEARGLAQFFEAKETLPALPTCRDPDDQKFLEAAAAAGADFLITKDDALLELARRKSKPPFRIVTPIDFAASAP